MYTRKLILVTAFAAATTVMAVASTAPVLGAAPAPQAVQAMTLEYAYKGQTLTYLVDASGTGVTVAADNTPTGAVTIPATITVGGTTYTVTGLEDNAFYYATAMTSLTIEANFDTIAKSACWGCTALTTVSAPNVKSISASAFRQCTQLCNTTFSSKLYFISESAFNGCAALKTFNFPSGIRIYTSAFYGCTGLESVTLDADEIGALAFYGCTGLLTATIKSTTIGNNAFAGCCSLRQVNLKSAPINNATAQTVSQNTFSGSTGTLNIECELPSGITFGSSTGPFSGSFFEEVNVSSSYVPANLLYNQQFVRRINLKGTTTLGGIIAPLCYSLGSCSIEGSSTLGSYEGCIYSADYTELKQVPAGRHCIIVNGACNLITANIDTKKTHYMDLTAMGGRIFASGKLSTTARYIPQVIIREGDRNGYASSFSSGTQFISSRPRFDVDGNNAANARDIKLIITEALKEK